MNYDEDENENRQQKDKDAQIIIQYRKRKINSIKKIKILYIWKESDEHEVYFTNLYYCYFLLTKVVILREKRLALTVHFGVLFAYNEGYSVIDLVSIF